MILFKLPMNLIDYDFELIPDIRYFSGFYFDVIKYY